MKREKTIIITVILIVFLALILSLDRGVNTELPIIRVGTLQGGISTLDVMEATDIPANNGFSLNIVRLQKTPDILAALVKGDVDIAVIPVEMAARLIMDNTSIRIIAVDMLQNQAILSIDDFGSMRDLCGKKIGALLASGTYKMFKAYMKTVYNITVIEDGVPGDDEILAVNVLPGAFLDALKNGDVDAVVVWEPFVSKGVVSYNASVVKEYLDLWLETGLQGSPVMLVYVVNGVFATDHLELVKAFVKAREDAALFWINNKESIIELLVNQYMLSGEEADYLYDRVQITTGSLEEYVDGIKNIWYLAWMGGYLNDNPSDIGDEAFLFLED